MLHAEKQLQILKYHKKRKVFLRAYCTVMIGDYIFNMMELQQKERKILIYRFRPSNILNKHFLPKITIL